jgi:hypothetical protein
VAPKGRFAAEIAPSAIARGRSGNMFVANATATAQSVAVAPASHRHCAFAAKNAAIAARVDGADDASAAARHAPRADKVVAFCGSMRRQPRRRGRRAR